MIRSVFEVAIKLMKSVTQLLAVIEKLEDAINFHDFKNRAQLGDVYEQLLNDLRGAGNAGEFYTPRALTAFMVDRVNPRLASTERVLDPACGTGGFLTATIEHFRKQLSTKSSPKARHAIEDLIRGFEKKQLPHLLCTTNMLLHGIDVPSQIEHKNTLSVGWNDWSRNDFVDCIVTNPPFGGYEDDTVGSGYHHPTKETADLFMQLIVKLLKDHGRAAVVLPDGFLFGDGIKAQIKERLLQQCKLHTIVRLPKGVFAPYTTIKTNLLFFTKGEPSDDGSEPFHTENIWFYEHPYPADYKSYSKTRPIRFEEFAPEIEWWGKEADNFATRTESEFAWKVDFKSKRELALSAAQPHWTRAEELKNNAAALDSEARKLRNSLTGISSAIRRKKANAQIADLRQRVDALRAAAREAQAAGERLYWPIYQLDLKNPRAPEDESHDPDLLLEKYKTLLGQIEENENRLRSELAAALAHHFVTDDA